MKRKSKVQYVYNFYYIVESSLAIRLRKQNNGSNVVRDLHDRQLIGKTWKPEHQKGFHNLFLLL